MDRNWRGFKWIYFSSTRLKLSLVYSSQYGLEIHVLGYVAPSADWPESAIATLLGADVSDVLPPFEGSASLFEVYSESGLGVKVTVGEGNEAGAVSSYVSTLQTALFEEDSSKENCYTSPNEDFKVQVVGSEAGYIDIQLEVLPKWPANGIANTIKNNLGEGITDVLPPVDGADEYSVYYDSYYDVVSISCYFEGEQDVETIYSDYLTSLASVGHFSYVGYDSYGNPYYNSQNNQYNVNPYLYGDEFVIVVSAGKRFAGVPATEVNEYLLAQNPELIDTVPGFSTNHVNGFDISGKYALIELYFSVDDEDITATYIEQYASVLVNEAHYVLSGTGPNGGNLYVSPNGEIEIELYNYDDNLCIDINLVE